jgi:hypothetical protein
MVESNRFPKNLRGVKLRVLNPTEGTVVTPDVVQMDTASETFTAVAQRLQEIASGGIWLNPYRGVPRVSWMPELDIVYLDEHFQVIRSIESYRQATMELPEMKASSALVLPAGRLSAARIQFGDQLELHDVATGTRMTVPVARPDQSEGGHRADDEPLGAGEHAKGIEGPLGIFI